MTNRRWGRSSPSRRSWRANASTRPTSKDNWRWSSNWASRSRRSTRVSSTSWQEGRHRRQRQRRPPHMSAPLPPSQTPSGSALDSQPRPPVNPRPPQSWPTTESRFHRHRHQPRLRLLLRTQASCMTHRHHTGLDSWRARASPPDDQNRQICSSSSQDVWEAKPPPPSDSWYNTSHKSENKKTYICFEFMLSRI